jgi:hypothetical protein
MGGSDVHASPVPFSSATRIAEKMIEAGRGEPAVFQLVRRMPPAVEQIPVAETLTKRDLR